MIFMHDAPLLRAIYFIFRRQRRIPKNKVARAKNVFFRQKMKISTMFRRKLSPPTVFGVGKWFERFWKANRNTKNLSSHFFDLGPSF